MSLPDYYQILQVPVTATSAEIKTAYRRLAKLFHPDKNIGNPASEEKFKQIKEAYEHLINPLLRRKYDEKRNRAITRQAQPAAFQRKQPAQKNYTFSQEEAERRKYYQKHYKTTSYSAPKTKQKKEKTISTELKYILISVPIAVALLLLIIRLYEKPKKEAAQPPVMQQQSEIHTPYSPYESVFGQNIFDTTSRTVIRIENRSGFDGLVFLEDNNHKIIRHHFIENNYQLLMEHIPYAGYRLYYWLGKNFRSQKKLFAGARGSFEKSACVNLLRDTFQVKKNTSDTFFIQLSALKYNCSDTSLLRTIFGASK